jgi:hypothetical protein
MQRCWAQSPDERPSFAEVTQWVEQYQADTYDHIDDVTRDLSLLDDATIDVDTAGDAAQDPVRGGRLGGGVRTVWNAQRIFFSDLVFASEDQKP